ncbi:transmembrane protein 17B isoform X2 [Drosophila virilis]|uniref:transmembrane protein 17B isoform X2 n=1 Tax=Drosophila virilis TaxID=7244 RepID=UPI00139658A2|nr:uncharacterized protein LOC6633469 isoform X2 [Drosophila virilis]
MPHIVSPIRSNLLLQILLEGNLYIASTWCVSYVLYMLIYWSQLGVAVLLVFSLAVITESLRIYVGYTLNLSPHGLRPKLLLFSTLALCLPLLCAFWYLRRLLLNQSLWLQLICNVWAIFIALELVAAVGILWSKKSQVETLPNWSTIEANLKARRRRLQRPPGQLYKL